VKILLTGATGFLGYRTLEMLIQQPEVDSVIAGGRSIKPTHKIDHPKVRYLLGDLSDESYVDTIVKGSTHLIHAAALSSPWGKIKEFETANLYSQLNLIKAAEKYRIKSFVFISSPSIYFEMNNRLDVKETDPHPKKFFNAYAKTKRMAEMELERSDIPYVILRPRALIGRGDTVIMPRLIRAYEAGKLRIIGKGENIVDLTAVSNVADAIWLSVIANHRALNKIYNISNGEPVNLWDAISEVLRKLDKTPPTKKIPFGLVKAISGMMELKSKMTNMKEPVLTQYGVGILAKSLTLDISRAREFLNYRPKMTTSEAIDEFVNWYKQH